MGLKIQSGLMSGQVLQRLGSRGADAVITGTGDDDGPLRATLLKGSAPVKGWNKRAVGKIVRGKFRAKLTSIPVGGPYRLRLEAGRERVDVAPVFVGDVWILAGQSNMEGVGNMTGAAKPHPRILAFSMRREWRLAEDPLHILSESPDRCHTPTQCTPEVGERLRQTNKKGVGAGIFFAREMLHRSGDVPQGLICTAHGGTSMEQWSPERKRLGGDSLYASMLMSVEATGQPVAGVLWYQGESDATPADVPKYTRRMQKLVAATRRDLRQPRLPWAIVQIGRFCNDAPTWADWNGIQEQQRVLPGKIKFLETVPAIDLPLDDPIHIGAAGYPRLGVRLARVADRLVYGNKREAPGPQIRSMRWIEVPPSSYVEVAFDHAVGGLRSDGEPRGFSWVNPAGVELNLIYRTELEGNKAKLYMTGKPDAGLRLHYGHGYVPACNITDARDFALPVAGPLEVDNIKPEALLPFITEWNVSPILPATKALDKVDVADVDAASWVKKSFSGDGFINEHPLWEGKSGQAFFRAGLTLPEPMKLAFLIGYDGPIRIWIDGAPFFVDMAGINPCIADESKKTVSLTAGAHEIVVGMDLNGGLAWGFFLRFARKDVSAQQRRTGNYARAVYSVPPGPIG